MERIPLKMKRPDLQNIPDFKLIETYHLRFYQPGEENIWARVETSVDEFPNEEAALAHFEKEFGPYREEMAKRCLFLENSDGEVIGTSSAWYGILEGEKEVTGRVHWVAIMPDYQGKKLAKPLFSQLLQVLATKHKSAYLTSQTTSYQAINLYLNFGFEPYLINETDLRAWKLLEEVLERKIL